MRNKKRICLVTPCILPIPAVQGGAIETLVGLLVEQNEIEQKVDLIVVSNKNDKAIDISGGYKYTKFIYIDNDPPGKGVGQNVLFRTFCCVLKKQKLLWSLLKDNCFLLKRNLAIIMSRPDYIVAEGGDYASFKLLTKLYGLKRVYLHLHHELYGNEFLLKTFGNVIAVSEYVRNRYAAGRKKILESSFVVRNCVDEKLFLRRITSEERRCIRRKLGFDDEDFVLVFCGRMIPEKGVKQLVDAVNEIGIFKIKLLLIGSINFALGGNSEYLQNVLGIVNKSGGRIKFSGYVPNNKLYKYYQAADLQVIPSICNEAAGLVCLEGILSSLPIIASNSGGMPEYLEDTKNILLDKPNNINDGSDLEKFVCKLRETIISIYNNKKMYQEMRYSSNMRQKKFSVKNYYNEFVDIFLEG